MLIDPLFTGGNRNLPRDHSEPLVKGSPEWDAYFPKKEKKRTYIEDTVQISFIKYWNKQYPLLWRLLYHIKNSGFKKQIMGKNGKMFSPTANRDKNLSVVPGVSDLYLSIPNDIHPGWYIEVKRPGGKESANQEHFGKLVQALGYKYSVIDNLDEFVREVEHYMEGVSKETISKLNKIEEEFNKITI